MDTSGYKLLGYFEIRIKISTQIYIQQISSSVCFQCLSISMVIFTGLLHKHASGLEITGSWIQVGLK